MSALDWRQRLWVGYLGEVWEYRMQNNFLAGLFYFYFFLLISPGKYSSPFHTVFAGLPPKSCPAAVTPHGRLLGTAEPGWCCLPGCSSTYTPPLIRSHTESQQERFLFTQRQSSGFAPLLSWLETSPRTTFGGDGAARRQHPVPSSSPALLEKGTLKIPTYHAWFTAAW